MTRFQDLGRLKPVWRVSLAALVRTSFTLGLLTDRQYRTWNMKLNQLPGGRKHEPGEFEAEEPQLIKDVMAHFHNDPGYSDRDISQAMASSEDSIGEVFFGKPAVGADSLGC